MEMKWALLLGLFLPSCSGCAIGYKFVKSKCVDEDECAVFPIVCGDHAQCTNTEGSYFCTCNEGFKMSLTGTCKGLFLQSSESRQCGVGFKLIKNKICVDEDECSTSNQCGDHAQCVNTPGSYYCTCNEGFRSATANFTAENGQCEDINECVEKTRECTGDMVCVNTIGSHKCICQRDTALENRLSAADVDECLSSVCGVHSSCTNTPGSFFCICSPGFHRHENNTCTDINECSDPDVCGTNADCFNHPGGYSCKCHEGYSNYGNNQSKCIEMDCDQFEPKSDGDHTPEKLKHLMSLLKSSCESLNDPRGEHFTGEKLLESLCSSSDELLSDGNIADGKMLSHFLDAMENSVRLIGPQLREPVTRMETHSTFAEVAVTRNQTPPSGRVTLSSDSALFSTSWETVVGDSYPGFAFAALVSYKDLNSSSDLLHKMRNKKSDDKERSVTYQLNSKVVTAVVSNAETKQLSEPVKLVFRHVEEKAESGGVAYSCVYWDETEGAWSGRGCERAESNSTHTVCSCSHLSSFAVLMALYPVQDSFDLVLITRVGLALSLVCLFLCILTFRFCRSIQGTRTSIHLHLSICLFIADLIFLCGISSTHNQVACAIVAGLLHFFFLSAFCWMLLEGVQLYRMVVLVFHTTLKHLHMYLVGYGVPLVIVIISAIAFPKGYGTELHCWLSLDRLFILSFFVPVCIVMILNCFFFIITVWKLAQKFSSLNPDLSNLNKIRSFTVTAVAQLCVLGGTWIFGGFLFQEKGTEVMLYLFTILNSLQGAFIFIMHCLLSKPVRTEYYNLFVRMCPHEKKVEYSSSNSQKPLRSEDSTGESHI
ncbi:adhesion G protein-coupled receptor E1-like [Onychostoma macrolepis]|uniref:adhesion G protein-coupled receptor E1-like n=1 Tax=Onychostoma macrolepis TaxID=369639 RepID=UPI002729A029|nr:adhesion G protein-coupled receptor E1-like [Onychostoma macrolepis]